MHRDVLYFLFLVRQNSSETYHFLYVTVLSPKIEQIIGLFFVAALDFLSRFHQTSNIYLFHFKRKKCSSATKTDQKFTAFFSIKKQKECIVACSRVRL